jgi:hypothetical protein
MKFITSVSMPCTKEQYEADLKEPLKEMGYKEGSFKFWDCELNQYITNNFGLAGKLGNVGYKTAVSPYYHFIPTYDPALFLALAAMTDAEDIMKWECYVYNDYNEKEFSVAPCNLYVTSVFRKATKEEILKYFEMKKEKTEMKKEKTDQSELIQSGNIVEFSDGETGIVIDTQLGKLIQFGNLCGKVEDLNEDLGYFGNPTLKIVRIRKINFPQQIISKNFHKAPIIWERKEKRVITVSELLKTAGIKGSDVTVEVDV